MNIECLQFVQRGESENGVPAPHDFLSLSIHGAKAEKQEAELLKALSPGPLNLPPLFYPIGLSSRLQKVSTVGLYIRK